MALREKLNNLAASANIAIENGKLNLKVNNEEKKISDFTLSIGMLVLDQLDAGEVFDDEVMALYSSLQAAREVILNAKAEIEANTKRQVETNDPASDDPSQSTPHVCPHCGVTMAENAKFCSNCGVKVEAPEADSPETCSKCGAELESGANFCNQCGEKV